MAYVINGGDKPSSRFHDFVDLCCEAYNLMRKHAHLFLDLLGLVRYIKAHSLVCSTSTHADVFILVLCVQMLSCGIPELSELDDLKYVYDALRPHESEADATMYFTRSDPTLHITVHLRVIDLIIYSLDMRLFPEMS